MIRLATSLMTLGMLSLFGCASFFKATTYEATAAGEVLNSLTKLTESANSVTPFGGDDDGFLFYIYSANQDGHYDLYKREKPLSNSATQMTDLGTSSFAQFPSYCKATDKVAFCMGYDIYIMPATKGKAMTQITSSTEYRENHPSFSPNGEYLAYDRNKTTSGTNGSEIWIRKIKTGENIMLGKGWTPSFSRDGKNIVYAKSEDNKTSSIWIMDLDGENQVKITDNNTIKSAQRPRFSPDGKLVIFDGLDYSDNLDLYVVSANGGDLTRLTINKSNDMQPYWSTDGYIYFASDRGGKENEYNIWRFKY